jgi:hypothetical protein
MPGAETPEIMKFTVLPYDLVAKAWLDPVFGEMLVTHPRPFLLETSDKYTRFAQYIILRDTPSLKHFVLPHVTAILNPAELEAKIEQETGDEEDYSEFLPAAVIYNAFTDVNFKAVLIRSPNATVEQVGLPCPYPMKVVENSADLYHIPLRANPSASMDYRPTYENLRSLFAAGGTTKCCATGTCALDAEEVPEGDPNGTEEDPDGTH